MEEKNLNKERKRIKAVELWKNKFKISGICITLKCSRAWLYKWLGRYRLNEPASRCTRQDGQNWYKEQSRRPTTIKKKIDHRIEELVIETRKQLMITHFMQYGPQAIYYSLEMRGITSPPVWSIARMKLLEASFEVSE